MVIIGLALLVVVGCSVLTSGAYNIHPGPSEDPEPTRTQIPYTPVPLASHTELQLDRAIRAELSRFPNVTVAGWRFHQGWHELRLSVGIEWHSGTAISDVEQLADALISSTRSIVEQYEPDNEGRQYYSYLVEIRTPSGGISVEAFLP